MQAYPLYFLSPSFSSDGGDKSQVRATGPSNALTCQPVKGRNKKGGIRDGT